MGARDDAEGVRVDVKAQTVGVSVTVAPPLGQYDPAKLIDLGNNRWSFKPEIGLSRTRGPWVLEAMAGVWLLRTTRTSLAGARGSRTDCRGAGPPDLQVQAHHVAGWRCQLLHRRTDDDRRKQNLDLQRNSRVGATFSRALDRHQAIRSR